jgi:hypothetical protein
MHVFIVERVRVHATHLLAIPGCGELTAAKIIAETANIARFKSEAAFARYIGVAPLPVLVGVDRWLGALHEVGQQAAQQGGPSHRGHADPHGWAGPKLLRQAPRSRRFIPGGVAQPEAAHQPCRVHRLKADEADRHPQSDLNVNVATADTSG